MTIPCETTGRCLRVRMLPDWRGENPYQELLAASVRAAGVDLSFVSHYRRGLPVYRDWLAAKGAVDAYHLHWLAHYVRFEDGPRKLLYALKFLADLRLVKARRTGLVWTVHNLVPHEARFPGLERWLNRRVAALSDHIIVHSRSARDLVTGAYGIPAERLRVIPHGHYQTVYGPATERAEARARLSLPAGDERVLLFLGFVRPYKGVEDLIAAWRRVRGEHSSVSARLLIAGKALDTAYAASLRQLAEADPTIDFRFGFVDEAAVPVYFGAADGVALPFRSILTSGSLLLALGFGRPIVAPRLPLVEEILGAVESPLYDPAEGVEGLARAVGRFFEEGADPARGVSLLARATDFDWGPIGEATAKLYADAARRRRSKPAMNSAAEKPRVRQTTR